ncbi:MAG: AbrB/MazE/SpoVT family DNA-binding domain-containing protein [Candidatus Heimdallarchaeota archaeon]|nr:AbrB/MazE/SpoVT family DNA-binding domain-containing protein [Candidatus Heimdallarchaeota archaeon]
MVIILGDSVGIPLKRKVQSHRGLSLQVTIPKEIVEEMELKKGDILAFYYNSEEKSFTCKIATE